MRSQRRGLAAAMGIATLIGAVAVRAQDPAMIAQGHQVFEHTCAPCHGAGPGNDGAKVLPAVAALQLKYHGTEPALIEHRTDLPYAALRTIVRAGTVAMPPFRPTEITDAQIAAVAAYLANTARTWIAAGRAGGN